MGSQYLLTCVCFWLPLVSFTISVASQKSTAGPGNVIEGNVFINGTTSIGRIDDDFVCATLDWWPPEKCDYGTCSWGRDSLLNLDLNNLKFLNAIKAFSPLKIRLGGTLQDKVIYERAGNGQPCSPFVKNNSEFLGFSQGCLPMSRWDELSVFFKKAGAVVVFGLNELSGKTTDSQGNELSGNGIGARVSADQYASDINSLQNVVQNIYAGFKVKPQIVAPGGFFDATWFTDFIKKTPKSLQVVSHHIYNLGPGVDDHLIEKILDPSSLDSTSQTFSSLQSILKNSGTQAVAWVGEAGGAYNSGHNLVTNAFVFSIWTNSGWHHLLIPKHTVDKHWLVETMAYSTLPPLLQILITTGITLLLINLDGNTTVQVRVSTENNSGGTKNSSMHEIQIPRTRFATMHRVRGSKRVNDTRKEYHLTAKDGDLHSQTILLNGKILNIDSSGLIPPLIPIDVNQLDPIIVVPFSIVFAQIPYIKFSACN
ncbi:heparanase-like protein 3 [Quercus suber]|uniref:Heparanase-like protein 3 n=1 Tax=Quercus suber TaxID=58331 RepID=A0AAW0KF32_QUESU